MITVIDPGSMIRALQLAKDIIEKGWQRYICLSLTEVTEGHSDLYGACVDLKTYIGDRCKPNAYCNANLEDWLLVQLDRHWSDVLTRETYLMCRLAWIDRMIYQLKQTGELP